MTREQINDFLARTHRVPSPIINGRSRWRSALRRRLGIGFRFPGARRMLGVFRKPGNCRNFMTTDPYNIPFNRSGLMGANWSTSSRRCDRPDRRRSDVHQEVPRAARRHARRPAGAAHHVLHPRAGDGGAAARHPARRRSHRPVVHVRLDGQRVRPARRQAGVLRRAPRHAEPRRSPAPRADHARAPGRSCRSITPASAARWTRSWRSPKPPTASRWSRTTPTGCSANTKGSMLGTFGALATQSFHETKNITCGEGGALLINDPTLRRAGRDHPRKRHQPQPVLPRAGRQIHLGRRRLQLPDVRRAGGVSVRPARSNGEQIQARRKQIWETYDNGLGGLGRRSTTCGGRSCRRTASRRITCSTCCCRRWSVRQRADRASEDSAASSACSIICRCTCPTWASSSAARPATARSPKTCQRPPAATAVLQ